MEPIPLFYCFYWSNLMFCLRLSFSTEFIFIQIIFHYYFYCLFIIHNIPAIIIHQIIHQIIHHIISPIIAVFFPISLILLVLLFLVKSFYLNRTESAHSTSFHFRYILQFFFKYKLHFPHKSYHK